MNGILDHVCCATRHVLHIAYLRPLSCFIAIRYVHVSSLRGWFTLLSLMLRTCNGMVSRCIEDDFLVFIHLCIAWAVKALLLSASASVPLFIFVRLWYTRAIRLQEPHFVSRLRIVEWVKQAFAIDALLRWRNGVILWFQKVPCFDIAGLFTFG